MQTWDAIRARRNVRAYQGRPIPAEDLDRILEAGRRAPSSMNGQPWDFVVVTERATLERLAEAWRWGSHLRGAAAAVAFVVAATSDPDERETGRFDTGQAAMSMMLAAADLGIGSCHSSVGEQDVVRGALGMPEDRECVLLLSFGYPADRPLAPIERPDRRSLDDVVHRERW